MAQAFVWGQGGAQLTPEQVAQQRAIAAALMKEGSSYAPVGSWLEGLGRVANAAAGAFKEYRANQAEKAGQEAWQQKFAALSPSLGGSSYVGLTGAGSPAIPASMTGSPDGSPMASGFVNGIPQNYFAATRGSESGGNPNAKNPNSSASGLYQFTDGTWSDLMKKYPALGLTADGRMDPAQQELAMQAFTLDNAEILKNSGVPISGGSLYAAHFLGAGSAPRVLTAPPETPMTSLVSSAVIKANPFLADMTAGDFAQWAAKKGGDGSTVAQSVDAMAYAPTDVQVIPGDSWNLPGGANPRASNPQAEVAAALMGTNPDLMPQPAAAMVPTQAGKQPMPQPRQPVNTAGMNYDPATGMIGPAAGLNAGATLAPAATEAFYGGQSPVQKTDTPILRQIAGLLGGGQGGQQPAAPNGQRAVAQALAGQPMSAQSAASPQGMPSIGQLMELAADPYAPEGAKAVVNALIQQQLQQQDPAYRMGLEKSQLELEQLRNPTLKPIEVGGVLLDPKTYQPIYDSRQNENRPTDDMREYEAAKAQGFTGTLQDWILSQKKAGAASTTVNMGEGDKFYENLDKKNAETFAALSDAGMQARAKLAKVGRLQELLATSPQGPIAALKQAAGEWGINTEGLSDIQAASSIIESLVPQQRTPGSGPMSDADIAMYRASLPRLINQPGGNEIIINTLAGIAQYEAQMGEIADMVADRAITPAEGRKRIRELKNPLEGFKAPAGGNQPSPMPTGNSRSTLGLDRKPPVVINGYTIEEAN